MALKMSYKGKTYKVPEKYSFRELAVIRRTYEAAGVEKVPDVEQAANARDPLLLVAQLVICKQRAGEVVSIDAILDDDSGDLEVKVEKDAVPLDESATPEADETASEDATS